MIEGNNWTYPNYDIFGTNHNPQNSVNKDNVGHLAERWQLEVPWKQDDLGYGVIAPPLIVNGTIYLATNAPSIIAVNAVDGKIIWEYRPRLHKPHANMTPHLHGMSYFNGLLLFTSPDCSVRFVNATTGFEKTSITNICDNVPGNAGIYGTGGPAAAVDPVRGIVVWGPSTAGGTAAGRGFVAGYSLNGTLLWRWFITPPAGGDPSWDFKYTVERINKTFEGVAKGNVEPFQGDWGDLGFKNGRTRAGGGLSFGQMAVDVKKGIIYLSTSNPKPDWNSTYRPGPNLYTNSIIALDVSTGDMLWFFQAVSHDIYNHECAWNTILVQTSAADMVFKGCKNGEIYALNAADGRLLWLFTPPSLKKTIQPTLAKRWHNDPSDQSFLQCPGAFGGIESDMALGYGKVFAAVMNLCTLHIPTPVEEHSPNVKGSVYNVAPYPINTTIYALDMFDGRIVWSYFINSAYRGWLTVTGGMVIASTINDGMLFLDAENGRLLRRIVFNGSLRTGAVVGSDIDGRFMVLQLVETEGGNDAGSPRQKLVALSIQQNNQLHWLPLTLVIAAAASLMLFWNRIRKFFVRQKRRR
ncbi:MAG: PQQ-binding-like beta-propeller repeat protein [Candidatus Caldarchaeum sp.]